MIKCDPRAKAKCPFKNPCCRDDVAYFVEGSECDEFNRKVLAPPPTNADRIRSMSDEELAKFIDDIALYVAKGEYCTGFLNVSQFPYSCFDTKDCCEKHAVEWLQKPAEDDDRENA